MVSIIPTSFGNAMCDHSSVAGPMWRRASGPVPASAGARPPDRSGRGYWMCAPRCRPGGCVHHGWGRWPTGRVSAHGTPARRQDRCWSPEHHAGIGQAIALAFASAGASVMISSRQAEALAESAALIDAAKGDRPARSTGGRPTPATPNRRTPA